MKTVSKIIFASVLALSTVAPAFAYEGDFTQAPNTQISTSGSRAQQVMGHRVRTHRGIDANAYEPDSAPAGVDLGIGSQN